MPEYSNLPQKPNTDSATKSLLYFNEYGQDDLQFKSENVDAALGFLKGKGFGEQASIVTGIVLLKQAKQDGVPVYQLLESLKGLQSLQLSSLVGTILNESRLPTSSLGFRTVKLRTEEQKRIIIA